MTARASPCNMRRPKNEHHHRTRRRRPAGRAAPGRLCGLRRGRLCPGQSAGPCAPRLGPLHRRPPGAGDGAVRRKAVHPHRIAAWHRDREAGRQALRDHHLPHRGQLFRWPPPRQRGLCTRRPGGPGPAGLHHQRHGLQRRRGLVRPLWRAGRSGPGRGAGRR